MVFKAANIELQRDKREENDLPNISTLGLGSQGWYDVDAKRHQTCLRNNPLVIQDGHGRPIIREFRLHMRVHMHVHIYIHICIYIYIYVRTYRIM